MATERSWGGGRLEDWARSEAGGGGGSSPVKSGVMEGAGARAIEVMEGPGAWAIGGGVKVIALMVLLSCLLYMEPRSETPGDTMGGPGSLFTGVRLNTIPSLPVAGVRSNVARGSAVKLVLRASKPKISNQLKPSSRKVA